MGVDGFIALVGLQRTHRARIVAAFAKRELQAREFKSVGEFFKKNHLSQCACVFCLLNAEGVELQKRLLSVPARIPLVFWSTSAKVRDVVQVMRSGALHVLEDPLHPGELLETVQEAITVGGQRRSEAKQRAEARKRLAQLTARERQVFDLVVQGLSSKQIADKLFLSDKTVQLYRALFARKLECRGVAEQVRLALLAEGNGNA